MREINDRHNAIFLAEVALKIIDSQDFSSEYTRLIDLTKARLLTTKGSVSIQLLDYTTAKEALGKSIEIYERYNPSGDDLGVLTSQAYLASVAAAQGEYEEAVSLSWTMWLLLSSPHFNGDNDNGQRILQMHASILAGKVAILVGKYSEATSVLDHASGLFVEATDNPIFDRAILHASGNLHYAKGSMAAARAFFHICTQSWDFGNVMHVNQADEERTISIYHRLAVMDIKDERARAAR
jgi:tetratricopeptide (TPR) repeat protein